jgi:hypothetical protein
VCIAAATTPLTALIWVFAISAVLLAILFLITGILAFRHRRWRKNLVKGKDPLTIDELRILTVGDLVMDSDPQKLWSRREGEGDGTASSGPRPEPKT